jgi:PEP-CTERM motif
MKVTLRSAMYLCLAIATVTMLSAGSVAAVHSTTGNSSSGSHISNPGSTVLYDDGPTNGAVNAVFIDGPGAGPFSQTISDGFTATGSGAISSINFGIWVPTGTTPTSISWWIGSMGAFSTNVTSGKQPNVTDTFLLSNGFGYDVYEATIFSPGGSLSAGTQYWLTLGGANDSAGTQFDAWDVNGGPASCSFAVGGNPIGDCGLGSPEGEAFTIYGTSSTTPEPGSLMLLGSGVVGLAGFLRRKLSR